MGGGRGGGGETEDGTIYTYIHILNIPQDTLMIGSSVVVSFYNTTLFQSKTRSSSHQYGKVIHHYLRIRYFFPTSSLPNFPTMEKSCPTSIFVGNTTKPTS